jgi:hypothetical protein
MLELKKVSVASQGERAHICTPCYVPCLPFNCNPIYE